MAEPRDDALRKRYRELATEEPSAALDDAIRAAARRAVSSGPGAIRKPGAARWAVPVSLAAVLFLSFSVVMRLEKEAPPIGEPTPSVVASPPPASSAPMQAPARASTPAETAKEAGPPSDKLREQPRMEASPALRKEKKDAVAESKPAVAADAIAPAKPQAPPPAPAAAFVPAPAQASAAASPPAAEPPRPAATMAAPAPVLQERAAASAHEEQRNVAPARRDQASGALAAQGASAESRAKAEGYAAKRVAEPANPDAPWPDTVDGKLERIEALRKAGRDKEADEAISRFRREHPDYRIPEATWERIRPK